MKSETQRIKEYRDKRIKEGKACQLRVLINDEYTTKYLKEEIKNISEFVKEAIKNEIQKRKMV